QAPIAHLAPETLALVTPPTPGGPLSNPLAQRVARNVSTVRLRVDGTPWQQQPTLVDFGPNATVYRIQISDLGEGTGVFGHGGTDTVDEQFGLRPRGDARISVTYRVGGGASGNVAPYTLVALDPALLGSWFASVSNPLAAASGRDLESRDHAQRTAP